MEFFLRFDILKNLFKFNFCFILLISSHFSYSAEFKTEPVPDWVKVTPLATEYTIPKENLANGVYNLLVDSQTNVPLEGKTSQYFRSVQQILNPTGVERSSQINLSYDPNYQQIQLHSLIIWRNNVAINKTDTAKISILQQENELESLIYNGEETLNIVLDDVRVGDTLEYSYNLIGTNPVFNRIFSQQNNLQWSVPVLERSVRILWGKNTPLNIRQHNANYEVKKQADFGGTEYLVKVDNTLPLLSDKNVPGWFDKYASIEFSESKNWRQVVEWSLPLFNQAISKSPSIQLVAKNIQAEFITKESQLIGALNLVQQEVRYLGIEMGSNSHKPSPADETLARRYGDCKDKTVLLISILKLLDIEAYPALVNSDESRAIGDMLATPNAFDHVIVKAILNGKNYWLDPTRQYQNKNLSNVFQPNYDLALIISNESDGLASVDADQTSTYTVITDEFTLPPKVTDKVVFHSSTQMSGYDAERNRRYIAKNGLAFARDSYLKFYKDYYSNMLVKRELDFEENDDGTRTSHETYEIEDFWEDNEEDKTHNTWFYPNSISAYLSDKNSRNRIDPLVISHPVNITQIIKVKFADSGWEFSPVILNESNDIFDYTSQVMYDKENTLLTLTYTYKTKKGFVSVEELDAYNESLKKLDDEDSYGIYRTFNYNNTDTNKQAAAVESDLKEDNLYQWIMGIIIFVVLSILLASIVLWRLDVKHNPFEGEVAFYPVSVSKFILLTMITFGIYSSYWIYKNFKYIKQQSNESIMPVARGIFDHLWFYSLYSRLVQDSNNRFERNLLPHVFWGILMALAYFIFAMSERYSDYTVLLLLASALVALPLVNYVNLVNKDNLDAKAYNSKWSLRHYLLSTLTVPLIILTSGSSLGILPSDAVIEGDEIHFYDLQYLQRKKVIEPDEEIKYFYSDAFLFIRNDGNGFTDKSVFSYWLDENDSFNFDKESYENIKDIEVTWSKTNFDNTVVKIIREDDSSFLLFVSHDEKKDKLFVDNLKSHWQSKKQM